MLNRVVLVGRLTRDPELRVSQNNLSVTTFNLAVNRPFSNKQGEQQADFINCVAFRKQAENVSQYLNKGALCGVDGRIQTRNYENKDGQRVYVTEVICESVQFLEPKSSQNAHNQGTQAQNNNQGTNYQNNQNNSAQSGYGANNNNNQNAYGGQNQNYQNQQNGNYEPNPFDNPSGPVDVPDSDLPF